MSYANSRAWMTTVAGVLMLVAGAIDILRGVAASLFGDFFTRSFGRFIGVETFGWLHVILGIFVIIAGYFALRQRAWWLVLIGAIVATLHFWLIGLIAIILVALSKGDFY